MHRARILEILYHPAFISLILWLVFIFSIPLSFSRYHIKTISHENVGPCLYIMFSDLDSDGTSEKITFDLCDQAQTKIMVYHGDKVIDQYNVAYQPSNIQSVYFDDYNGDSQKEIYVFTINDSTIFLSVLDPVGLGKALANNRVIDQWDKASQSIDKPNFTPVGMVTDPGSLKKDLVFLVSTGFSIQPRNLYRYNIDLDSLVKSPESYATIDQCLMVNQPGNLSGNLFLLSVQSTGNTDSTVAFSDIFSWLMVLDTDLEFTFTPIKVGNYPSKLVTIPFTYLGKSVYLVFYDYFGSDIGRSMFYIYDETGSKITEKEPEYYDSQHSYIFGNRSDGGHTFYFVRNRDALVEQLDMSSDKTKTYTLPPLAMSKPIVSLDADMDGNNEYIFIGGGYNSLVISQSDFSSAIEFPLGAEGTNFLFSQLFVPGNKPMIHLQLERNSWILLYERNPLYYLKGPLFIGIYLIIFLFISIIYRIQRYRLELKKATEREIATLQMKAISNQVEPHFTLNVLNAIGGLYLTEENREQADYIFSRYASLIRQTVITSDKIIIPLEDELEFVRNYIDIERFRSGNSFDYTVNIDPGVDTGISIPRMLIFTFAENAVKHGLRRRTEGGLLEISVRLNGGHVIVTVDDNGPGLVSDGTSMSGTGRGLKIVSELTGLFYRLEKVRITYSIEDLSGRNQSETGTSVTISIPPGGN